MFLLKKSTGEGLTGGWLKLSINCPCLYHLAINRGSEWKAVLKGT